MENEFELHNLKNHYTIRQAAKILGVSYTSANRYVRNGQLEAQEIGDIYLISGAAIANFKRRQAGRPRTSVPEWRFSSDDNHLIITTIEADLKEGVTEADFLRALEMVKRSRDYLFQGTIERYIFSYEEDASHVQFFFVWRQIVMPQPEEVTIELAALRTALAPVLAWDGATYRTGRVWMHT